MAKARKRTESATSVIDDNPNQAPEPIESPVAQPTFDAPSDPRDRIAMRAYELFLERGGGDGGDFDDWLAAEREIAGGNGHLSREDAGE